MRQDAPGVVVVAVEHERQYIAVRPSGNGLQEVTGHEVASIRQARRRETRPGIADGSLPIDEGPGSRLARESKPAG